MGSPGERGEARRNAKTPAADVRRKTRKGDLVARALARDPFRPLSLGRSGANHAGLSGIFARAGDKSQAAIAIGKEGASGLRAAFANRRLA